MNDEIYQEALMELYRHPLNKIKLGAYDNSYPAIYEMCGDKVEFFVKWSEKGTVQEVGWEGDGCAISQVSCSLFSDKMKGKTLEEIKKITPEEILKMLGIPELNPVRMKCATLPLEAMKESQNSNVKSQNHNQKPVSLPYAE